MNRSRTLASVPYMLAATSLVLLAGTLVLWVASYFRAGVFCRYLWNESAHRISNICAEYSEGGVVIAYASGRVTTDSDISDARQRRPRWASDGMKPFSIPWALWTYENRSTGGSDQNVGWIIGIRLWMLAALEAIYPVAHLAGFLRRRRNLRRAMRGQCYVCGYDLRATPDRCPECGAIPEKLSQNSD